MKEFLCIFKYEKLLSNDPEMPILGRRICYEGCIGTDWHEGVPLKKTRHYASLLGVNSKVVYKQELQK